MSNSAVTLLESWGSYRRGVLQDAPASEVEDFRMAFYAGAMHVVSEILKIDDDDVSEEEGLRRIQGLQAELLDFGLKWEMKHRDRLTPESERQTEGYGEPVSEHQVEDYGGEGWPT